MTWKALIGLAAAAALGFKLGDALAKQIIPPPPPPQREPTIHADRIEFTR
jgi:hypothetical protein